MLVYWLPYYQNLMALKNKIKMSSPQFQRPEVQKCRQDWLTIDILGKTCQGNFLQASSCYRNPWHFLVCGHIIPISAIIFTWLSLSLIKSVPLYLGSHLDHSGCSHLGTLNSFHPVRTPFYKKFTITGTGH